MLRVLEVAEIMKMIVEAEYFLFYIVTLRLIVVVSLYIINHTKCEVQNVEENTQIRVKKSLYFI